MEIEEYKFASVALLYQKYEDRAYTNKVRAVLVTVEEGDDEYDIKAKAERYCTEHFEEELEDMSVVAWSMGDDGWEDSGRVCKAGS